MAKRKRKDESESVEETGDAYEPSSAQSDAMSGPWDQSGGASSAEGAPGSGGDPNERPEDRQRRRERKPHPVLARYFKDRKVELIDEGNAGGVGIRLTFDDPAERPSEEVRTILKSPQGNYPGLTYKGPDQGWRKHIGSATDPKRAVAIRMDVERRFEEVGEQMSHEERLKAERDQRSDHGPGGPS